MFCILLQPQQQPVTASQSLKMMAFNLPEMKSLLPAPSGPGARHLPTGQPSQIKGKLAKSL